MDPTTVRAITEAATAVFLKIPGVHVVGFGSKKVSGQRTGEPAIIVYVDRKRPSAELAPGERIPPVFEGIKTDVVAQARVGHADADSSKYRPLEGGCQLAEADACNQTKSTGTLGCICLDTTNNNNPCLLTNHHVLDSTEEGGRVYQPGADCNCCDSCPNVIAFKTRGAYSPEVDGAIATLKSGIEYSDQILDLGAVTGTYSLTPNDAASGTYRIWKRGRSSLLTDGILDSINCSTTLDDRSPVNQIKVDAYSGGIFSLSGDSGAVYVNESRQVVGLNWGAPDNGSGVFGLGSPIDAVLSELQIELYISSTASLRAGPGLADPLELLARKVQGELAASPRGRDLVAAFHQNRDEIWALAGANRRVMAAWRRNHGVELYRAFLRAAQDQASPMPARIADQPVSALLDKIVVELLRCGSLPLRSALLQALPEVRSFIGRTYPEAIANLNRAAETVSR